MIALMGEGKSGYLAQLSAGLLRSVGVAAVSMNPHEVFHGDMAMLRKEKPSIVFLSETGKSEIGKRISTELVGTGIPFSLWTSPGSPVDGWFGKVVRLERGSSHHAVVPDGMPVQWCLMVVRHVANVVSAMDVTSGVSGDKDNQTVFTKGHPD